MKTRIGGCLVWEFHGFDPTFCRWCDSVSVYKPWPSKRALEQFSAKREAARMRLFLKVWGHGSLHTQCRMLPPGGSDSSSSEEGKYPGVFFHRGYQDVVGKWKLASNMWRYVSALELWWGAHLFCADLMIELLLLCIKKSVEVVCAPY